MINTNSLDGKENIERWCYTLEDNTPEITRGCPG
jgi:hypothetical protein